MESERIALKRIRISSGIADLDLITEGGYRSPGNIILIGPTGLEKSAMAYHFASAAGDDEASFIVCANSSPDDLIEKASNLGMDLRKENIFFIDCYSATLGKEKEATDKVSVVPGPGALNDLSLALNEAIRRSSGKRMRVVFDTLSAFILYNPKESIRKFLNVIEGRLKSAGATTLFLLDEGVHDKQLVSLMEQGADERFVIVDKGGKFMLQVPDVPMDIPVRVGPSGLAVV